jgi:phosphatidylserine/phosphatidylglycerophosphate/cardiolipin synthase-like enzyme
MASAVNEQNVKTDNSIPEKTSETVEESPNPEPEKNIKAYFTDISKVIKTYLEKSDGAYVCTAWLTSTELVNILSELPYSEIIIGDEKYISSERRESFTELLPKRIFLYEGSNSSLLPPQSEDVHGEEKFDHKMMHNKFIILLKEIIVYPDTRSLATTCDKATTKLLQENVRPNSAEPISKLVPDAVITGSANYTVGSAFNYENIVWIHDRDIANQYLQEYNQIKKLCKFFV